jgi:molybdopterin-guanine dinucleotide biosynthesis protein A
MYNIPCAIFAGGKSSRMGTNKALLPFGDHPTLTQYQFEKLSHLFTNVMISTKDKAIFDFDAPFIEDNPRFEASAPTVALATLFEYLPYDQIFVISVDTPLITPEIIDTLITNYQAPITVAKSHSGTHPLIGIYDRSLLPKLEKMIAEDHHKLGKMLQEVGAHTVYFDEEEPFTNLNYFKEYEVAKQKA